MAEKICSTPGCGQLRHLWWSHLDAENKNEWCLSCLEKKYIGRDY